MGRRTVVAMTDRRLHRGTGSGFRGSVAEFKRRGDPTSSGRTDRAGNGAAMRIAPAAVALRYLPDEEFVARLVDVSLITHRELRAIAGMLAVASNTQLSQASCSPRAGADDGGAAQRRQAAEPLPLEHHAGPDAVGDRGGELRRGRRPPAGRSAARPTRTRTLCGRMRQPLRIASVPMMATGTTGAPVSSASRPTPRLGLPSAPGPDARALGEDQHRVAAARGSPWRCRACRRRRCRG